MENRNGTDIRSSTRYVYIRTYSTRLLHSGLSCQSSIFVAVVPSSFSSSLLITYGNCNVPTKLIAATKRKRTLPFSDADEQLAQRQEDSGKTKSQIARTASPSEWRPATAEYAVVVRPSPTRKRLGDISGRRSFVLSCQTGVV